MSRFLPLLLIIAVLATAAIQISTPEGLGVFPDSVQYIQTAAVINSGAFSVQSNPAETLAALSRFPPLFPALISPFMPFNSGVHHALRIPFSALAGINAVLLGFLLYGAASRDRLLAIVLTVLGVTSTAFIRQHLMLYSEPLFLALELGILLLILPIGSWQERTGLPVAAAFLAMLASLVRYAGIAFPPIAALCATVREDTPGWRKAFSAVLFASALLPVSAWMWFVRSTQSSIGGRTVHESTLTLESLTRLAAEIGALIPPLSLVMSGTAQAAGAVVLVAALSAAGARTQLGRAALSGLVVYLGFIIFAHSTIDSAVPFNDRILLPALPFLLVLIASALSGEKVTARARVGSAYLLLVLAALQIAFLLAPLCATSQRGFGFSNRSVSHSKIFAALKEVVPEKPLVSNYPEAIVLHSNRPAAQIPNRIDPGSSQPNLSLETDLAAVRNDLKAKGGLVVWFTAFNWRKYQPERETVLKELDLEEIASYDIATIYRAR